MGNILLLHALPPKKFRFKGVEEIELLFKNYNSNKNVIEHNFFVDPPSYIKEFNFDAIILTSTFLERITHPKTYKRLIKKYSFLEKKNTLKIGLPQDDYWAQETKDNWYSSNLDIIVSVFNSKYWPLLYPISIKKNIKIIKGHTTYIDNNFKPFKAPDYNKREFDVVYRTVGEPYFPNNLGLIKSQIGTKFFKNFSNDLNLNISNRQKDSIFGIKWYQFLGNSKAVLGSNSGSSVIVRNHDHIESITAAKEDLKKNMENFENIFFDEKDRNFNLTDISPRNIEAARTMTLQVLIEGEYGGVLKKNIDYFCLKEDFSNANELFRLLKNPKEIEKITKSCFNTLKESKTLRIENLIETINKEIDFFIKKNQRKNLVYISNPIIEFFSYKFYNIKFYLKHYLKRYIF